MFLSQRLWFLLFNFKLLTFADVLGGVKGCVIQSEQIKVIQIWRRIQTLKRSFTREQMHAQSWLCHLHKCKVFKSNSVCRGSIYRMKDANNRFWFNNLYSHQKAKIIPTIFSALHHLCLLICLRNKFSVRGFPQDRGQGPLWVLTSSEVETRNTGRCQFNIDLWMRGF